MYSQPPHPYEPTDEYPVRSWSRPICLLLMHDRIGELEADINRIFDDETRHVINLSDMRYIADRDGEGEMFSIYTATIVYQARTPRGTTND